MMKKFIKLIFISLCIMFLMGGCFSDVPITQNVKLLIGFGSGMDFCLINIDENGIAEYISCSINNADLRNENIVDEIYEKKEIRLSNRDKTVINELIQEVLVNEPIKKIVSDGGVEIRVLIEDEKYSSRYHEADPRDYDKNVANLAYKLVELAPFNVGGDVNPLRVPND